MEKSEEQELAKIKAWLIEQNPDGAKLQSFDEMARGIFSARRGYYPEDALYIKQPLINRFRPDGKPGKVGIEVGDSDPPV